MVNLANVLHRQGNMISARKMYVKAIEQCLKVWPFSLYEPSTSWQNVLETRRSRGGGLTIFLCICLLLWKPRLRVPARKFSNAENCWLSEWDLSVAQWWRTLEGPQVTSFSVAPDCFRLIWRGRWLSSPWNHEPSYLLRSHLFKITIVTKLEHYLKPCAIIFIVEPARRSGECRFITTCSTANIINDSRNGSCVSKTLKVPGRHLTAFC